MTTRPWIVPSTTSPLISVTISASVVVGAHNTSIPAAARVIVFIIFTSSDQLMGFEAKKMR
jgi:hypothetical protein